MQIYPLGHAKGRSPASSGQKSPITHLLQLLLPVKGYKVPDGHFISSYVRD